MNMIQNGALALEPTETHEYCDVCNRCFAKNYISRHMIKAHQRLPKGSKCIAKNVNDALWIEGVVAATNPCTMVLPKGLDTPLIFDVVKPISVLKNDPSIFIGCLVAPKMEAQKTIECDKVEMPEENPSFDDAVSVCSSVTSECDLSSEADFPTFNVQKKAPVEQAMHRSLPYFQTLKKVRVRCSPSVNATELTILEARTDVYRLSTFDEWASRANNLAQWISSECEISIHQFYENLCLNHLATVGSTRQALNVNKAKAASVMKKIRSAQRKALFAYNTEQGMTQGWISLKKGKNVLCRRVFGASRPVVCITNISTHSAFDNHCMKRDSFENLIQEYRNQNSQRIPTMKWLENMMLEFLASNDVSARSVEWNGNFTSSKRYGSETGPVTYQKGRKTYTVQHTGYCVPERTCFVEFNTHRDAEKFLSMDLKTLTHGDSTPLYSARSCFEKTYENLRSVVF